MEKFERLNDLIIMSKSKSKVILKYKNLSRYDSDGKRLLFKWMRQLEIDSLNWFKNNYDAKFINTYDQKYISNIPYGYYFCGIGLFFKIPSIPFAFYYYQAIIELHKIASHDDEPCG